MNGRRNLMMKQNSLMPVTLRLALAAGAVLFLSSATWAAAPALSAAQVISKNVAARGGIQAWRAIHTLSFAGKMDAGRTHPAPRGAVDRGGTLPSKRRMAERSKLLDKASADQGTVIALPYRMEMKRPHKVRIELDFAGQTAVQIYDGVKGSYTRPYLGYATPQPFTPVQLKQASEQSDLEGLLIDAVAKGGRVAIDGVEPVEGHPAYKLRVTLKDGATRYVWVDANTFLDVKVDGSRLVGTKVRKMFTVFRDYRKVDGVMIPFVMETVGEGTNTTQKIVIDKVMVNSDLTDARFEKL
jgi:hypothetical protein